MPLARFTCLTAALSRSQSSCIRDGARIRDSRALGARLEKKFPIGTGHTYALRHITLDVDPGDFVSIMGPSGAGKSTLLNILGIHDHAWSGEYRLMGQPVHQLPQRDRAALQKRHIGFVFQSYHLLDTLTVYENIELPLSYRDVKKSERQSIVADLLDRFGICGEEGSLSKPAVRRAAAAGGHRPGHCRESSRHPR
jgi:ABC-type lipoprotein export system ATPase subunit